MSSASIPYTTTIDGVTYDITHFLKSHPGGEDMLLCGLNRDASVLFHSYHRNVENAKAVLEKLPKLSGKKKSNTIETPLYATLKERVNKYFKDTNQPSRGTQFMWFKSAVLILLTSIAYYYGIIQGYWMVCPILGILMAINGLAIQHDANHGSFSKYPFFNRIASVVDDIIGGSSLIWRHQHVVLHHTFPNHHELDGDSYSKYPVMRLNPKLETTWYIQYQWFYGPFLLYSLLGISYSFEDVTTYLSGHYLTAKMHYRTIDQFIFWGGKLAHYFLFVFVPVYLHGWTALFTLYILFELVGSNFLATVFAVSHNTSKTEYNVEETTDWAELQIRTSANWSVQSTLWWLVSGGLNFQIEHHLFPGVCHVHYPAISRIVQEVCKEYNLPYNAYPTFFDIYKDHLSTLQKLGKWKQN
eukprot:TRINITY_DN18050_c0_g1_i1.p1 TRINITY_DN18050_c0_g1~~TRINITY_DN18050_c0_g1_i1.p1  ORF type:complete len:413 (-),score=43.13 TRINITY_DN18050_c0_g1_i1:66-1304(-)